MQEKKIKKIFDDTFSKVDKVIASVQEGKVPADKLPKNMCDLKKKENGK